MSKSNEHFPETEQNIGMQIKPLCCVVLCCGVEDDSQSCHGWSMAGCHELSSDRGDQNSLAGPCY